MEDECPASFSLYSPGSIGQEVTRWRQMQGPNDRFCERKGVRKGKSQEDVEISCFLGEAVLDGDQVGGEN